MESSKKILLSTIAIAIVIVLLGGVTFAFFNYTRTGSSNVIKTGRIAFSSSQDGVINLTNVFPIDSQEAETDTTNAKSVSITVTGDTDYSGGVEYLVTASDVNMTVNGKQLPVTLEISVDGNNSKTLGTLETGDYYTNRDNYSVSKYKIEYNGEIDEGSRLLVGYIAPNTTSGTIEGIGGVINIKAYIDSSRVKISDTYDGSESDNMGTTNEWVGDRIVFTTTEWNSIQSSQTPLSFKVKVEANEGIWVPEPNTLFGMMKRLSQGTINDFSSNSSEDNTSGVYETVEGTTPVYYYRGDVANNVKFGNYCWKAVRTTTSGGVKLVYNGEAKTVFENVSNYGIEYYSGQITSNSNFSLNDNNVWTSTSFENNNSFSITVPGDYIFDFHFQTAGDFSIQRNGETIFSEYGTVEKNYTLNLTNVLSTDVFSFTYMQLGPTSNLLEFSLVKERIPGYNCNNTGIDTVISLDVNGTMTSTFQFDESDLHVGYMYDDNGVKKDSKMKKVIDDWYEDVVAENKLDSDKIEITNYCSDQSVANDENNVTSYGSYARLTGESPMPSLNCVNSDNNYSLSVGFLTTDEMVYAGGKFNSSNTTFYLYNNYNWWSGSPWVNAPVVHAMNGYISNNGEVLNRSVNQYYYGIRPVISIIPGLEISSGEGSVNAPYIIS